MTIEFRNGKWCTIHCHGSDKGKIIACFPTKAQAMVRHRAIESSKHVDKIEIDISLL